MGSTVEINDTLQITTAQGFPRELNLKLHQTKPFTAEDFVGKEFTFKDKPNVRLYQSPPVRNFLVHNVAGTWVYWGLVYITAVTHDNVKQTTSGKFTIQYIYTPIEMERASHMLEIKK